MRGRATTLVAWSLWGVFAVSMGLFVWGAEATDAPGYSGDITGGIAIALAFGAFATVGALVASRRPTNSIGWLFLAIADLLALGALSDVYAYYALVVAPEPAPFGVFAAWVAFWAWFPTLGLLLIFPLLLFPTGAPPSPRWRPVAWVAGAGIAAVTGHQMVADRIETLSTVSIDNPIGIPGLADVESSAAGSVGFAVLVGCALAALASLVVRFRRSRGDERQQLKWYTFAAAAVVPVQFVGDLVPAVDDLGGDLLWGLTIACIPTAAGVAILKYRLYDIDRIINRTLVYGALSVLLGVAYVAIVGAVSAFVGRSGSELTIAGATLAVAALFQPLRRRVQSFIDRRFYRSRYDAARTVEAFAARLRSEVDLESLTEELLGVVNKTLQPAHASLWLRPPERVRPG